MAAWATRGSLGSVYHNRNPRCTGIRYRHAPTHYVRCGDSYFPALWRSNAIHELCFIADRISRYRVPHFLPVTALTLSLLGSKFLLVRNTVVSSLGEDYLLLARAKGLPERLLKYRHAGRNALLPFLTVVGIQAGFAASGSLFVEAVFAYPGMGTLILKAVEARDYPVLDASFFVSALVVILMNLMVDLLYGRLDPRTETT
jgi:ABC-type dipeptide/oligopeptide/nickel transport system permease component